MTKNNTIKNYKLYCQRLVNIFVKYYFWEDQEPTVYPVAGDVDGIWVINDYFFSINDIADALDIEVPEVDLFDWYESKLKDTEAPNLKNYIELKATAKKEK